MLNLWYEFRHAIRTLGKSPGFTIIAILTLGIGIGANTAIFSVVDSVLLEPLRYPEPDRIVAIGTSFGDTGRRIPRVTGGDLIDILNDQQAFEAISSYAGGEMGVQLGDHAEFTGITFVNAEFFAVYGVSPVRGRWFTAEDAERGAVVSLSFANRNFGGAARTAGKSVSVEGRSYDIVGVAPEGFRAPGQTEVWLARRNKPYNTNRNSYNYRLVARLKKGVSGAAAQAQMDAIAARLAAAFPADNKQKGFTVTPMKDLLVGPVRTMLYFLLSSVSLVLLIACANVANLLLARATARSREFAVRVALGASRAQIVRQLAMEHAVLGLLGGGLGLVLVTLGLTSMLRLAPQLPRIDEVQINPSVLLFTMVVSLAASMLFGLAPVIQTSRGNLSNALKQGGTRGLLGSGSQRIRKGLVVAEIALSVTLAVGAGLLFRSFLALNASDTGFRSNGILVMYTHVPGNTEPQVIAATRHFEYLFGQLQTVPGTKSVAAAMGLPMGRYGSNGMYAVEGKTRFVPGAKLPNAVFSLTSPGYFAMLGIPLKSGRDFSERDQYDAPFVAIVSESLVKQSFPNENPIGQRIQCGLDSLKWMTIVGVVGDVRQDSPASKPEPQLYMPFQQHPWHANELQVVLRTAVDPVSLIPPIEQRMRQLSPNTAVKFTTLEAMLSDSIATPRFRTVLVGIFAGVALLLAMAGIYGVMSYLVTQRTSEFGLRMALGAEAGDVMRITLSEAALLTGAGLTLGMALSFAAHRLLESMLFGLTPVDAPTYFGVVIAVLLIALGAAAAPAWRATRVDPISALRNE